MIKSESDSDDRGGDVPEPTFWESELYDKAYFTGIEDSQYTYYDQSNVFRYLFYHWVRRWAYALAKQYIEPYKYHPLPVADQVLRWQPIFSKHVSDGLVRLELFDTAKARSKKAKAKKPYRSVLLRALVRTFWKNFLVLAFGLIATNMLSMSVMIVVKRLLQMVSAKSVDIFKTSGLLLAIILIQIGDGLFNENITFYVFRLSFVVHYLASASVFQHGICHRRLYVDSVDGVNALKVCGQLLHSCDAYSECSKNPLFCQALRFQNKEISPKVFTFEWKDSYYVCQAFESIKYIIEFVVNFSYGVYLLSLQVKVRLWVLYAVGASFVFCMVMLEVLSTLAIKFTMYIRDFKITKCSHIFPFLPLIKKMLYDDIAINIITRARNTELSLMVMVLFLTFFNNTMFVFFTNILFFIILKYFVKSVNDAAVVTDIDTAAFMATFYIFMRIISSLFLIPRAIKILGLSFVSFSRIGRYLTQCSPNFYISDNKYTGAVSTRSQIMDVTTDIPKDTVVYYKDASFTWVTVRKDLLYHKYDLFLKNLNFQLKRGQLAIILGSQGSGKSNFIKSMLGEMTLVGGSMAVVPLYTSMPIFYASQDIWLQHGTIRSNIVFGHKFDEDLYNQVVKAVELEFDISTWENGDLRVVSDNAHSLSGGQRVRMEMARAVYAYLVFHKVNVEYNEGKCSFLMCLDASFHGLDPYVSKTIFNNLFNLKKGLLMKWDLAVVLTSSKTAMNNCTASADPAQLPDAVLYLVKDMHLSFYSKLDDFVKKEVKSVDFQYLSDEKGEYRIGYFDKDLMRLCSSGVDSRLGRMENTKALFSKSFKTFSQNESEYIPMNRYAIMFRTALLPFLLFMLLTAGFLVLDNIKFVVATRFSDHITSNIKAYKDGVEVDLGSIKQRSRHSMTIMTILVSVITSLSFLATITMTTGCMLMSRKIHEYVVNSVFNNSSSVIKIKKQINQVITYFTCDIINMDDVLGMFLALIISSCTKFIINLVTLFYLIPASIPFFAISMLYISYFILLKYVLSTQLMFYGYFETCFHVNSVLEYAISGSSVTRSFKKEVDFDTRFFEHRDYKARCKFLLAAIASWSSISFNWIFSFTTLFVLIIPIILDKYTKFKLKVGYFGLALSLCMNVYRSFNVLSILLTCLEMVIVSMERFKYFVPADEPLKFLKFLNTHEEYVINPKSAGFSGVSTTKLRRRRALEFKADNKKFHGLRRMFFHPKIHVLDLGRFLTAHHSGVELKNVCVFTSKIHTPEGMILKRFNVSAKKSEIIGMVGRTGAGKTTLLCVLQNIVSNRTGQVLLDGKDLNEIPKEVLRQIIGVLPQLPFVFQGWTIRRFLDPRKLFSDDDINRALDECGLLKFINNLPGGKKLNTVLLPEEPILYNKKLPRSGDRPRKMDKSLSMKFDLPDYRRDMLLSNSQLRTLWFAKLVLYRHFYRMVVVDEPPEDDMMDAHTARNDDLGVPIYELLKKYFSHCTTFVTAHDANVLKSCTNVWVIHDGYLIRSFKRSEIAANESIANIIEESARMHKP